MRRTVLIDTLAATLGVLVGFVVRFVGGAGDLGTGSLAAMFTMPLVWIAVMVVARSYEERFLWVGAEEFRRVFFAAVMMLATVGTVSWALKADVARGFVLIALPVATALTLLGRFLHRKWLHGQRQHGRFQQTTLLVGHRSAVAALDDAIAREWSHGYRVIGCALPFEQQDLTMDAFNGLPVLGDLDEVADVVRRYEVDTVAVLPCPEFDGPALRRLGWSLEDTEAELLLAPAITDIAGPRVRIRPVSGLPLMHVERPEFSGHRRFAKAVFDRSAGALAVLLLAPVFLVLAAGVKLTSRGPALFKHERIGRNGEPFHVYKFRTMVPDADKVQMDLFEQNEGNDVQFKMRRDPRITGIGAVLRRFSLDELPQLFNVVGGSMSLVGPRPHVTREVEQYGYDMNRRLLVKPGITGLWQVSGRSDLSWDDSVRLDVRYVENWSLTFDLMILWKTVGAVVRGSGAY